MPEPLLRPPGPNRRRRGAPPLIQQPRNELRRQGGILKATPLTSGRIPPCSCRGVTRAVPVFAAPPREGHDNAVTSFSAARTASHFARRPARAHPTPGSRRELVPASPAFALRTTAREPLTGYFMWARVGALI
ncbi:hypothetical protein NDU88_005404 [Pleurodeles waltl]|uniref:Uncharacterized protein n=1 Tax=Pleurodeles waltl TaxID=8319 RepID=A0AAV7UI04_PLEWA|nr:hypothetical protein NDU88_005404 [Pleurodeles waltl]